MLNIECKRGSYDDGAESCAAPVSKIIATSTTAAAAAVVVGSLSRPNHF